MALMTRQLEVDSAPVSSRVITQISRPAFLCFSDAPGGTAGQAHQPVRYHQYTLGQWTTVDTQVIVEKPVSLTINGEAWLTLMCTPIELEALAVGFLFNEGLIQKTEEIASVRVCPTADNVDVWLRHTIDKPDRWRRTSGCTGGITSTDLNTMPHPVLDGITLTPDSVCDLMGQLFEAQNLYREARGVHTSALSDGHRILVLAEDIGRHNTLDKISGRCLLEGIMASPRILLTTGRISSEMLQKSARIDAAVVITRTSPSSLSVRLAEQWGLTLIGYAHRDRFNIYAHPERITNIKS